MKRRIEKLIRAINEKEPLTIEFFYECGKISGLAELAPEIEGKCDQACLALDNQAHVAVKISQLLAENRLDEADELLLKATPLNSLDLVLGELVYALAQKRRSPVEREKFSLENKFCVDPFYSLFIYDSFEYARTCCTPRSRIAILRSGAANRQERNIWNSPVAELIRETILDGTFMYCHKGNCPKILFGSLPEKRDVDLPEVFEASARGPGSMTFSFDNSCNLWCGSCRNELEVQPASVQQEYIRIFDSEIAPMLDSLELARLSTRGDLFASPSMLHVLKKLSETASLKAIWLMTNGLLFDSKLFTELTGLHGRAKIQVSVDAAKGDTYHIVRRGGNFEKLKKQLRLIGEFRKKGWITHYRLAFVAQSINYREMPDFVRLAEEVGADLVSFSIMLNHIPMPNEEYGKRAVWLPEHPENKEFNAVLKDPAMKNPKVLVLSSELIPSHE